MHLGEPAPAGSAPAAVAPPGSGRGARARAAILDAALEVSARTGLGRASPAQIAARAGTSKTSVLYHFHSLQGLHRRMAVRVRERIACLVLEAAETSSGSLGERGRQLLDALFRPENRHLFLAMNEILSAGSRDPVVALEVKANYERAAEVVTTLLGEAPAPVRALAPGLVAAVQGHIDRWLWSGDIDPSSHRDGAVRVTRMLVAAALRED